MLISSCRLPKRDLEGNISTMQPMFLRHDAVEELSVYGTSYDMSALKDFFKYKLIELNNGYIAERVVMTPDRLFDTRRWWASREIIYPVWSKFYDWPLRPMANVYRYLDGSKYIMSGYADAPIETTILDDVGKRMKNVGFGDYWLGNWDLPYYTKQMPGYDMRAIEFKHDAMDYLDCYEQAVNEANTYGTDTAFRDDVDRYAYEDNALSELDECFSYLRIPHYNDRLACVYARENVKANDLFTYMSVCFKPDLPSAIPDPFEITSSVVVDYNVEYYGATLKYLLYDLELSVYTDIVIDMVFSNLNVPRVSEQMTNCYARRSPLYGTSDFIQSKSTILNTFGAYANYVRKGNSNINRIKLTKTWNEEVFIEHLSDNKVVDRYYIDLIAISMASPVFSPSSKDTASL